MKEAESWREGRGWGKEEERMGMGNRRVVANLRVFSSSSCGPRSGSCREGMDDGSLTNDSNDLTSCQQSQLG
jgi:hypothetical protein